MSTNYRQQQKQNTAKFNQYSKKQQKHLRSLGYNNVGTANVQNSAQILANYQQQLDSLESTRNRLNDDITLDNLGTCYDHNPGEDLTLETLDQPIIQSLQAMQIPYNNIVKCPRFTPYRQYNSKFNKIIRRLENME